MGDNSSVIRMIPEGRWHVPVQDDGFWRMGVYRPEDVSSRDITELEKHTCPELFLCARGRAGLLLKSPDGEREVILEEGESILVTDYHNGFMPEEGGYFLVVERTSFTTRYIDRATGQVIRTVTVGKG